MVTDGIELCMTKTCNPRQKSQSWSYLLIWIKRIDFIFFTKQSRSACPKCWRPVWHVLIRSGYDLFYRYVVSEIREKLEWNLSSIQLIQVNICSEPEKFTYFQKPSFDACLQESRVLPALVPVLSPHNCCCCIMYAIRSVHKRCSRTFVQGLR